MAANLDVVCSRTLELRHADGTSSAVVVRVGRPRPVEGADCRCEYEIEGLSKKRTFGVYGVDEMQALWLALVGAGVDLRTSEEGKAGRITFCGEADLFFPPAEQLTHPEWHLFTVDGEDFHWRRYPSWRRDDKGSWERRWSLEVARRADTLGVGTTFPEKTVVGIEQARDLVRLAKEHGQPIL
jgi:hypothetical protein